MKYKLKQISLVLIFVFMPHTSFSELPKISSATKNIENNIHWLGHASFMLKINKKIIYIAPWNLKQGMPKADFILLANNAYSHFSEKDIKLISSAKTEIIATRSVASKIYKGNIKIADIGKTLSYGKIKFTPVPAYNIDNRYYSKNDGFAGFVISTPESDIYYAGTTDLIPEMHNIKCNIAILPVAGTYSMDSKEAVKAISIISPEIVIPMQYGTIIGSIRDAETLKELSPVPVLLLKAE